MTNIVYTTTLTKEGVELALSGALHRLIVYVPLKDVSGQAFVERAPRKDDQGRGLAFRLTDEGLFIFRHGITGPPPGFKEWPANTPEPDFSLYPIDRTTLGG